MSLPDELIRLIKEAVRNEVKNSFMLNVGGIAGRGGDTVVSSMGDILLRTQGTHKAYYNGTEILTGSGTGVVTAGLTTNYLPKATASAQIGNSTVKDTGSLVAVENNLDLYKSGGSNYILSFKHPSDSTKKCQMYLFTGVTQWDFIITATGQLKLAGGNGILLDSPVQAFTQAGNIAMSGYKLTGLGAGTTAGDSVRYEQIAPSISEGASVVTCVKDFDVKHDSNPGIAYRIADGTQKAVSYYDVSSTKYIFSTGATTIPYSFRVNAVEKFNIANDGLRAKHSIFFEKNHSADDCYIVDDANGTMELHVPSGQKLKVVVG